MSTKPSSMKPLGLFFCGLSSILIVIGLGIALRQGWKLATYVAVPAIIEEAKVDHRRFSKRAMYAPRVTFNYTVDGAEHRAHTPFPTDISTNTSTWAHEVVGRFRVGERVTAWAHPRGTDAYLLRDVSFFPYGFVLFAMIFFSVGLSVLRLDGIHGQRLPRLRMVAMIWLGVGMFAFAHYSWLGGQWSLLLIIAALVYGGLGSALLYVSGAAARKAGSHMTGAMSEMGGSGPRP